MGAATTLQNPNPKDKDTNKNDINGGNIVQDAKCTPKTRVVFHKTHKCSSSTVQNILLRYALNHKLNVVLPSFGNYVGRLTKFNASDLEGTAWHNAGMAYDMFCLHNRWNGGEMRKLMEIPDKARPVYLTMLRDPVELFRSLWDYFAMADHYGMSLELYALSNKSGELLNDRIHLPDYGRNQMMWDFGLDPQNFDNPKAVMNKVKEIDDTFDLVMLTEWFNESIVLMRDALCWKPQEVTSLKLNVQRESSKSKLSTEARNALKSWLWADYQLYNHFLAKFNQRLKSYGHDQMESEIKRLTGANGYAKKWCIREEVPNETLPPSERLWGHGLLGYRINKKSVTCKFYGMLENKFLDYLRAVQTKKAAEMKYDKIS